MADTRGTFRLKNVRQDVLNNEYIPVPNVWLLQDDIAHSRPYPTPNLQRWNLGTSTMTNTSLSCSRYWGQASGNTTFSYFAGGGVSPGIAGRTNTDKLSYSPYTFAATPTVNTSFPIRSGGALSSNLAAYITAGYNSTGSPSYNGSYVDKILFATDTKSTLSDTFGETGNSWASLSDGKGGGYNFNSDVPSPARPKLYKITYSTDGMAYVPASNTLITRRESSAEMMNPSAGYNTGGDNSGSLSSTEKLSWSSGTWTAVPGGKLVRNTKRMASGSGRSHGFAGGGDGNVAPVYTDFYKLDFSTETFGRDPALNFLGSNHGYYPQKSTTTPLDGLYGADKAADRNSFWSGDTAKRWFDDAAKTNNNAYNGGGAGPSSGNARNSITKFDFSTDTAEDISPSATLSSARYKVGAVSSLSAGYWMGGHNGTSAFSRVDKLTYATDSVAYTPGANLSGTRYGSYCTGNTTKGYSGGANTSGDGVGSVMDRLTYATDTTARLPGSNLTETRIRSGVAGSLTVGYWMGSAWDRSATDRMTYSTESVAVVPSAQLPTKRGAMGATASATDVYAAGGRQSPGDAKTSQILKLNLSSESISVDASLASIRYGVSGAGNATKGYFIGGSVGPVYPSGARTSVNKLTYSTSTVDTTLTQPLVSWESGSMARRENSLPAQDPPTATPTASTFPSTNPALNVNCIFKGGYGQPGSNPVSFQDKMTYSNETISSLPSFTTVGEIHTMGGGSSTTKGYTAGGFSSGTSGGTRNYRGYHTYSNDTSGKVPGNALAGGNGGGGMFGMNSETEFWSGGGGWSNNQYTYVDKMVFATETGTANPARLSQMAKYCAGIGNKTVGFVCGGNTGPHGNNGNRTNIDKLVYSTGTMSRSTSDTTLAGTTPYRFCAAVGTKDVGYIGGGGTNKLVFSTETISTAPAGVGSGSANGVSSIEAGYTAAGSPAEYVLKYTFATESYSTLPGKFPSPSNRKRSRWGAVSTSMFAGATTSIPNVI